MKNLILSKQPVFKKITKRELDSKKIPEGKVISETIQSTDLRDSEMGEGSRQSPNQNAICPIRDFKRKVLSRSIDRIPKKVLDTDLQNAHAMADYGICFIKKY